MLFRTSRNGSRLSLPVAVLIASLLMVASGLSQTISSTLLGTVTDPSGNFIPGAVVVVINESTSDQRSSTTDPTGSFGFPSLLPGSYTVKVTAQGFRALEKKNNILSANERLSVGDLQLTLGSVTESVSVTAGSDRVQTASSESSEVLNSRQVDTIAQKGRVLYNYLLLLPG